MTLLISVFAKKKLKLELPTKGLLPWLFSFYRRKNYRNYTIVEASIDESIVDFINESLKDQYDFFVWRNVDYMRWKYERNPAFQFKLLQFIINGKTEAVLGFTDVHFYKMGGRPVRSVKILDAIINKDSKLSHKDLLVFVADLSILSLINKRTKL